MNLQSLAIRYQDGSLLVLDQQLLPHQEVWLFCHSIDDMCQMIQNLKVRGAPMIGIAAVLSLMQYVKQGATADEVKIAAQKLEATRPTAVNLKNYLNAILNKLSINTEVVLKMGCMLFEEDKQLCQQIASHGSKLIAKYANVMTYCNTGSLATAGIGTALGVIKESFAKGNLKHVYTCETRPLLQGGRLTTWELEKFKIPYTLICDNMAGMVMSQSKVDAILVGADRIASNGDVANKIGTYSLAVLAKHHHIPFYVVAPYTTLDFNCKSAKDIIIECRDANEVKGALGKFHWAPMEANVYNPSFDITPGELVTNYILDRGIFNSKSLKHCA